MRGVDVVLPAPVVAVVATLLLDELFRRGEEKRRVRNLSIWRGKREEEEDGDRENSRQKLLSPLLSPSIYFPGIVMFAQ